MSYSERPNNKDISQIDNSVKSQRIKQNQPQAINKKNRKSSLRLSDHQIDSIRGGGSKKDINSQIQKQDFMKPTPNKSMIQKIIQYIVPQHLIGENIQLCVICEQSLPHAEFLRFGLMCDHKFCQSCLKQYAKFKLANFQQIYCPLQGCQTRIQEQSVLWTRIMSEQDKLNYDKIKLHFQVLSNPNIILCKNQKCKGRLDTLKIKQQFKANPLLLIKCQLCELQYCPECLQSKHPGTCDKNIIKFLQNNKKYRQCKKCKKVIQKSQGCTHMTCLCGFYFCYMCGQQLKGQHQCIVPQQLNCLQRIRWDISHREMFYQSNFFSFHRYLYCFDLAPERSSITRLFFSLLYTMTIYPISIVLALVILVVFIVLLLTFVILIFIFLPFSQLRGEPDYEISKCIDSILGYFGLFLCVIILYPIFFISIMIQALRNICLEDQLNTQLGIAFKQLGLGLRNILMMPFVLCVHPDSLDQRQNPQENLIKT